MTPSSQPPVSLPCPAERLLLHRRPMLLIDSLVEREGDRAAAVASITPESICYSSDRGVLPEFFIEIMAQTMAAANGYDALLLDSRPKDGFIVGLDKFTLDSLPTGETEFLIRIEKTMEFAAMKVMLGQVLCQERTVATVELKVWEQDQHAG